MFRVHSVSQRLHLRHLGQSLGGAEGLLEAVSFKKATEGMGRGRVTNARWERVPHSGGCNTETTGGKGSANMRNGQQVSVCRVYRTCGGVVIQKGMKVSRLSGAESVMGKRGKLEVNTLTAGTTATITIAAIITTTRTINATTITTTSTIRFCNSKLFSSVMR